MDIQKEREAFQKFCEENFDFERHEQTYFDEQTQCYENDIGEDTESINMAWMAWQAAKASTVPQWISTSDRMPEEGEEVLVHNLGQVRQVTRDSAWAGGFKERNCYGWQAAYSQSHWMPKSIELPERYHFYYENDAKQKAMIEAREPAK
ncbi:DUF551 domain-containing protein [Acinetobacter towneri]|uniref:DUF551 domain-containing protein n=1 Tax=Acinetobacter towneri TaxID=202956 RepID=UPI001D17D800|nr:DUF551 domain-containing protein [Acinetobacter towneri]